MPIHPISFSIPSQYVLNDVPLKTKQMATVVPGNSSTYVFTTQRSYYADYQSSVFGKTCKKGGWDCLRHYEILANGCIPWFDGLDQCPPKTMANFPKDLILQAMASETPDTFLPSLLAHTRKYCTSKAVAKYVLDTCGRPDAKRVLFLTINPEPDYLRCLTLIGFKELLGKHCSESVGIPHIYDDYSSAHQLYGRGFTYTRCVPASSKPDPIHVDDIKNRVFDLVIYGSVHRGTPYWEVVNQYYAPSEIVILCGEDLDEGSSVHTCSAAAYADRGHHVFIRELVK